MNFKTLQEVEMRRVIPNPINDYQRIVLFVGAIALVLALWTSPKVVIWEGIYFSPDAKKGLVPLTEPRTASMRAVGVIGATLLIFFAFKGYQPKKEEVRNIDQEKTIPCAEGKGGPEPNFPEVFLGLGEKKNAERMA